MPRPAKSSNDGDEYVLPTFVSCELSDAEKAEIRGNLLDPDKILDTLAELAADGYKTTISYDQRSDCVAAFLTALPSQRTNGGKALSSRGPSAHGALTVLFYKHFTKLKENWAANAKAAAKDTWG